MEKFDTLFSTIRIARRDRYQWSLSEIGSSEQGYRELLKWCQSLRHYDFDHLARHKPAMLGAVLLWLHAEVMRRHGGDGKLWPILTDRSIVHWQDHVWERLYSSGRYLLPLHKQLLESGVQMLGLRHAFDEDDVQRWYQLIYLQFGFTQEDARRRLSAWLCGQSRPVSVEKLLTARDAGAREFQGMWGKLRQFRLGNISRLNIEAHLRSCCWVLPEWTEDLIKSASEAQMTWGSAEEMDDGAFFTAPRLVWDGKRLPSFQVELCGLEYLLGDRDLELRCGGTVLRRLLRQTDKSLALDGDSCITLANGAGLRPQMELRLVTDEGILVKHGVVTLWNGDADVSLLRPSDGQLVTEDQLRSGQSFQAITFQDLTLDPPAHEQTPIGAGYVLHRYSANWTGAIQAKLDDMVVWGSSSFGARAAPLPMDVLEVRWRETLDITQTVNPSPWRTRIEVRVRDNEWTFAGMRWLRADGQLMKFKRPPEQLSLVEADAARPIRVRVVLKHQSGRLATVPVILPPPIKGCLRWPENGRPQVQHGERTILAADAQRLLWSFFLPSVKDADGSPGEVEPGTCSFMEGDAVRGRIRSRAGILPVVAGYGASAWISRDPYNSDEELLAVASRVIDGGAIGHVRIEGEKAVVPRFGNFELGPGHRLMVWFSARDKPGMLEQPPINGVEGGWEISLPEGCWLLGLGLFYQGARLGSWFDSHKWSGAMLKPDAASPAEMAALLRVWKAPLLHERGTANHRAAVVVWLRREWLEVVPVWLAVDRLLQGPANEVWPCPPLTDHWKEAVQSLLSEALPRPEPNNCWAFVEEMAKGSTCIRVIDKLGSAVMGVVDVCPLLGARLLDAALKAITADVTQVNRAWLVNQLHAAFGITDQTADDLARQHGRRDGVWLQSCIPSLHELNQPNRTLPLAYRRLAMNPEFRRFAFGTWLQEIRSRFHL